MIEFKCPHCKNPMKVPDGSEGKKGTCKKCGNAVRVPGGNDITTEKPVIVTDDYQAPSPHQQPYINPQPTVAVQVNNKPPAANSMGIASVVLGIIALLICWIPLVNMISIVLGGVGAMLAVIGLYLGMSRKGSGIGYPIAGGLLSLMAFGISVFIITAIGTVATATANAIDETVKQVEKRQEQKKLAIQDKWAKATNVATVGDVAIEITTGTVGTIELEDFTGDVAESEDEFLRIKLNITNNSKNKKFDYTTWGSMFSIDPPKLTDEHGNKYKIRTTSSTSKVVGQTKSAELYPGDTIQDLLVFDRPVSKDSIFKLELPGKEITGGEELYFKFKLP